MATQHERKFMMIPFRICLGIFFLDRISAFACVTLSVFNGYSPPKILFQRTRTAIKMMLSMWCESLWMAAWMMTSINEWTVNNFFYGVVELLHTAHFTIRTLTEPTDSNDTFGGNNQNMNVQVWNSNDMMLQEVFDWSSCLYLNAPWIHCH